MRDIVKKRSSGLELLKIICFCMIIFDHSVEIISIGGTLLM